VEGRRKWFKGAVMTDSEQLESFMTNYKELEDDGKDKLLLAGEKLLSIRSLVRGERKREDKIERLKFKNERLVFKL
jgi:hypothetical protein